MIPRLDFLASLFFAACVFIFTKLYRRIDINWAYQDILALRNDPWLTFYIPCAAVAWLLQLVAIALLLQRPRVESLLSCRIQLGVSIVLLIATGFYLARTACWI